MTTEKLVCERLCIDFCNKYEEQKSTIRELEARIAALTKDAERLKCFNQIWRWKALKDGEIIYQYGEHVPALFQKTAELLPTHPPAPKAITADDVTKQMVEMFENASPDELGWWGDSDRDDIIAAAVNAFNGVKP